MLLAFCKKIIPWVLKNWNYKNIIMVSSIFLALLFISILAGYSYYTTIQYIKNNCDNINISMIQQAASNINNNIKQIERITSYMASDDILVEYLDKYKCSTEGQKSTVLGSIKTYISTMMQFNKHIMDVLVITNEFITGTIANNQMYNLKLDDIRSSDHISQLNSSDDNRVLFFEPVENKGQQRMNADYVHVNANMGQIEGNYCFVSKIAKDNIEYGYIFVIIKPGTFISFLEDNTILINSKGKIIASKQNSMEEYFKSITGDKYVSYDISFNGNKPKLIKLKDGKVYISNLEYPGMSIILLKRNIDLYSDIKEYKIYFLLHYPLLSH